MPSILDHCTRIGSERLRPGTVMLAEGQKTDRIYVLIEGEIDVSRGDICITSIKEPGSIFGEMSLIMDGPPTFTVTARCTFMSLRMRVALSDPSRRRPFSPRGCSPIA